MFLSPVQTKGISQIGRAALVLTARWCYFEYLMDDGMNSPDAVPADSSQTAKELLPLVYEELRRSAVQTALGVPETLCDEPGVCGSWSLKELMGHLAFWDSRVADRLEARKAGRTWQRDSRSYDVINAEAAAARSTCTWDEIQAELAETHARLLPLLSDPGEEGDYRIYMHWREHGAQIEAWAAAHSHV